MTKLQLTKLNEPDFDKLYEMKSAIADFLNEDVDSENEEWMEIWRPSLIFRIRMAASSSLPPIRFHLMQEWTSAMSQHTSAHPFS